MKLLVQGDDFGFTRAVTYGIVDSMEKGILTSTGLFVNMPSSQFAAEQIEKHPDTCFGIDFNITSGPCVADPCKIPHLVDADGNFIRSTVKYKDPRFQTQEGRAELWPYEEVMYELECQYERFLKLTGKEPEYVHTHSIGRTVGSYIQSVEDIAAKYNRKYSHAIREKYNFVNLNDLAKVFNRPAKKEFNLESQLNKDSLKKLQDHAEELLQAEYAAIDGHPAYIDKELLELSTVSIERCKDLYMMTSEWTMNFIKDHHVELISYRDLELNA
jgi:hypothetical protein